MTQPEGKLAAHVRANLPPARIERQWSAIERAGLPGPLPARARPPLWLAAAIGIGLGGAVAVALALLVRAPETLRSGALVESAHAEIAVRLDDGSRVELAPRSQLRLLTNQPRAIELELRAGRARFQVAHDRARRFRVKAGPAEVSVVGTRFELTRDAQPGGLLVRVAVSEGVVEVRRRDVADAGTHRIQAGESWSALIGRDASAPAGEPAAAKPDEPAAFEPDAPQAKAAARAEGRDPAESGASAAFQRANLARRAGRMQEAADGYAELLARYPDDPRAGISAFELGRIRMDALDDPAGAIRALETAARAANNASFHEDGLARIVVANDALGRTEACRKARERYLASYPDGVHAHALAARCR
jgi:transmembrane sensor